MIKKERLEKITLLTKKQQVKIFGGQDDPNNNTNTDPTTLERTRDGGRP